MLVKRINLETGEEYLFDILKNSEFINYYSYENPAKYRHYALELCDKWNKQQPERWKYELI